MNVKKITALTMSFILILVIIPMLYSVIYRLNQEVPEQTADKSLSKQQESSPLELEEETMVTVFRVEKNMYDELPLEEYLIGVVSGDDASLI